MGRTARAGRAGVSVSLAGEQERKMVKDIIKRARFPVKNRVIPPDIVEKYKQKIEKLQPQIAQIVREEEEERLLSKAENQANKMEKMLSGNKDEVRPWFQTKQERKKEKDKLKASNTNKKSTKSKQSKAKVPKEEDKEISKVAAVQARIIKKKIKQKKISAVYNDASSVNTMGNSRKRKSHFGDLVNTNNAKKLRYQSKFQQKNKPQKKKR